MKTPSVKTSRCDWTGESKVYTSGDVAKILRVSRQTVYNYIAKGLLQAYRLPDSRDCRVVRKHLIEFMESHHIPLSVLGETADIRVLIVSDNPRTAELFTCVPLNKPANYHWVEGPFHAGVAIANAEPTAIVIDMGIGRGQATNLMWHLKGLAPQARIIAMPTEDDPLCDGLSDGFDAILDIPPSHKKIAEAIQGAPRA